ncbi:radical SAM family heme chaperone HemW [uncultured Peptoniphilus sp.]|uniref:radical SAM family heme chaperone HemW n=1 Tax=uncultured Peptoniphilus sp. TaxID=254354 RepID=UPI002588AECC|nr:radical SAM family heme chaperone HemW [uncultured Peptoniphilus sp.]MDU6783197.1 radical SAM family heme chaperone HemW [Peptoniphilus harei]
MKKNKISIYIHIPFCESRCHYCDFCSSLLNRENVEKYFSYLEKEIKLNENFLREKIIDTVFIGGGTPSSVDGKFIARILKILSAFEFSENPEITIESNPNSLSMEKAESYFSSGINRISIGAQSFNDKILKRIGRIHKSEDIFRAVENARAAGFKNINLDLMLALPSQKFSDIEKSLEAVKKLGIPHMSYYSLILDEGTRLYKNHIKSPLDFPDESEDREMYHYVVNGLEKIGLHQYEISNFSKKGYKCRHNMTYWKLRDYISFGLSASSNIKNLRYRNFYEFKNYYDALDKNEKPIEFSENLSKNDRMNEFIMMGLRLNSGIDLGEFNKKFEEDFLKNYERETEKNIKLGLIEVKGNKIKLTEKGRDLSNQVELDFFR